MNRTFALLAALLLVGLAVYALRPTPSSSPATASVAASVAAPVRVAAPSGVGALPSAEPTPAQAAKRSRVATMDLEATEHRRVLFQSNLAAVDAAVAKAEAEGGNPEYVAALEQRRALLADQAAREGLSVDAAGD